MNKVLPLTGIKVVAFEQAVSAPLCTRHMADLGAEVVKIERRGEGDFARGYDSLAHGLSSYFVWLNHGKKSLTLDIGTAEGQAVAHRLIARADVVVQNFAPGALDRRGLGVDQIRARYPSVIACSITGYGEAGPYKDRKAYDALLQAEAGVLSITGTASHPSKCGVPLVDFSAGLYAFSSILVSLYQRRESGEGAAIRVSLFDSIMEWMGIFALQAHQGSKPLRSGAFHPNIVPYGPYRARNGVVMLSIHNEREWSAFCDSVVNRPDWKSDARFNQAESRLRNRETLEPLIEAELARLSVREVEKRLEKASIAFARANDVGELYSHPQLVERGRIVSVEVNGKPVDILKPPFNIEGVEPVVALVPSVGEHTNEVLRELGFTAPEVESLRSKAVI